MKPGSVRNKGLEFLFSEWTAARSSQWERIDDTLTLSDDMRTERDMCDRGSVQTVLDFIAAVRDQRVTDMLALVDPTVVCEPLVRPGRSVYEGHDGMARFVSDMHAAFGGYQYEIDDITERDGATLAVQARILPESRRMPMPPTSVLIVFTLRDGLITFVEGEHAAEP